MNQICIAALMTVMICGPGCGRTPEEATEELHRVRFRNEDPNVDQIRRLISEGADVKAVGGPVGYTPIMYDEYYKDPEILKLLIDNGADANDALIYAVASTLGDDNKREYPRTQDVERLIAYGANVNSKKYRVGRRRGRTPLMQTAWLGTPEVAKLLIDKGADVKAKDNEGMTPLMYAGYFPRNVDESQFRSILVHGNTKEMRFGIIKTLMAAGAMDVNARDMEGHYQTPLMDAAFSNVPEIVTALIQAGADVNAKDRYGRTALGIAVERSTTPEIVRVLIQAGADVNAKDGIGWPPLMYAAGLSLSPEIVKLLIDNGAEVNAKNSSGRTPLMLAKTPGIVKLLKAAGARA